MECYIASKIKMDFALKNAENRKFHPLLFFVLSLSQSFHGHNFWGVGLHFQTHMGFMEQTSHLGKHHDQSTDL